MLFLAHSGGSGTDSTRAATAAPVPRSVGAAVAWLNSGNVATPVMRSHLVVPLTLIGTTCPVCHPAVRSVRSPSTT